MTLNVSLLQALALFFSIMMKVGMAVQFVTVSFRSLLSSLLPTTLCFPCKGIIHHAVWNLLLPRSRYSVANSALGVSCKGIVESGVSSDSEHSVPTYLRGGVGKGRQEVLNSQSWELQ